MDDPAGQAFTAASEATKQVIAVATGIVAITVAFLQNLKQVAPDNLHLLHVAWISAGVSVFFGVWTLLILTGKVAHRDSVPKRSDIYSGGVRFTAGVMIVSFLVSLGYTIAFGLAAT